MTTDFRKASDGAMEAPVQTSTFDAYQGTEELIVVGIGASAGGLEALREVLPGLPTNAKISYVVAQHLHPTHRSMLIDLLRTHTKLELVEAKNREQLRAGRIYVTPPGRNVTVNKGQLQLTKTTGLVGPKPSVDRFFTSLAEAKGERAVGIILSGTGSDGAAGVRAIKAHGGFTIAQAIESAKFDGMPNAAINTGDVDLALPPFRIGPELLDLLRYPTSTPLSMPEEETLGDVQGILQLLLSRTGCDFSDYKGNTLNRRIQRRMAINKLSTLNEYRRFIEVSTKETWDLFRDILVSVTAFFRDPEAFSELDKALQSIVAKKTQRDQIRIWVPGCATGEEAYSIAILLDRLLWQRKLTLPVQIFGTDLDENAILHARRGVYPSTSLAGVAHELRKKYFINARNSYQVSKKLREMVVFARHDLVKDPPFSHLDLISCRNVLIYFRDRLQHKLIPAFYQVLEPGGYLFLGKSESISTFTELFEPLHKKWKLFQRRANKAPSELEREYRPYRYPVAPTQSRRKPDQRRSMHEIVNQAIADAYAPSAIVVDDRMQVRHVRGDVSAYLRLSPGDMDLNVLKMARDELRADLRALLYRVNRDRKPLRSRKIPIRGGEASSIVTLYARPIQTEEEGSWLIALVFEEECAAQIDESEVPVVDLSGDARIAELEKELIDTREQLQTTVEELETTNEELQSTNEELQSANEELHSANEELETSNEELQSANEELRTLNEALQTKSAELASIHADVENVLKNIGFPMLVVNRDLRITRVTPGASELFDVSSLEIQPVVTSVPTKLELPDLREQLVGVIEDKNIVQRELTLGETVYWMRLLPYYSEENVPSGALIMFLDRTPIRVAENALRVQEARLEAIFDNYLYGIIGANEEGIIESFNQAAERIFGYEANEIIGQDLGLLMPQPQRDQHPGYIQRYLQTRESHIMGRSRRVTGARKDGKQIEIDLTLTEWMDQDRRYFIGLVYAPDQYPALPTTPVEA